MHIEIKTKFSIDFMWLWWYYLECEIRENKAYTLICQTFRKVGVLKCIKFVQIWKEINIESSCCYCWRWSGRPPPLHVMRCSTHAIMGLQVPDSPAEGCVGWFVLFLHSLTWAGHIPRLYKHILALVRCDWFGGQRAI